jgi:uncharacterized protein HemY
MDSDLYTQAELLYRNREFKKAQLLLKKEAVRPDCDPRVASLYGLVLARSDASFYGYYRGLKWCREAAKKNPDDPLLQVHLGLVYLFHGLRAKAVQHLDSALAMAPDDPAVLQARGLMGFRQRPRIPFLSRENPLNIFLGKTAVWLKKVFSRGFSP